ncbi:Uncharacterised protein [uncultured archaeon]|nr:Uncharacterised protein [uncultured archaeon]
MFQGLKRFFRKPGIGLAPRPYAGKIFAMKALRGIRNLNARVRLWANRRSGVSKLTMQRTRAEAVALYRRWVESTSKTDVWSGADDAAEIQHEWATFLSLIESLKPRHP